MDTSNSNIDLEDLFSKVDIQRKEDTKNENISNKRFLKKKIEEQLSSQAYHNFFINLSNEINKLNISIKKKINNNKSYFKMKYTQILLIAMILSISFFISLLFIVVNTALSVSVFLGAIFFANLFKLIDYYNKLKKYKEILIRNEISSLLDKTCARQLNLNIIIPKIFIGSVINSTIESKNIRKRLFYWLKNAELVEDLSHLDQFDAMNALVNSYNTFFDDDDVKDLVEKDKSTVIGQVLKVQYEHGKK